MKEARGRQGSNKLPDRGQFRTERGSGVRRAGREAGGEAGALRLMRREGEKSKGRRGENF